MGVQGGKTRRKDIKEGTNIQGDKRTRGGGLIYKGRVENIREGMKKSHINEIFLDSEEEIRLSVCPIFEYTLISI